MRAFVLLLLMFTLFSFGCSHPETNVLDSDMSLIDRAYQFEKTNRPIKIDNDTVVLDVRSFFDFELSRLPGALYVDAKDFSIRRSRGDDLQNKATQLARRLALVGINPFSHVVVVGYGAKGKGEEGVVALTLLSLGVERVQVGTIDAFQFLKTTKKIPPRPNQRYWEPRLVTSVVCPAHITSEVTFVVDVSKKPPLQQNASQKLATLFKDWKDFVNADDLSPNYRVKNSLRDLKMQESSRILIRGDQAPIVAFSMLQMGYARVCVMDQ